MFTFPDASFAVGYWLLTIQLFPSKTNLYWYSLLPEFKERLIVLVQFLPSLFKNTSGFQPLNSPATATLLAVPFSKVKVKSNEVGTDFCDC